MAKVELDGHSVSEFSLKEEDEVIDSSTNISTSTSDWPNRCGDGRFDAIIDDFEDPSLWSYCCGHDNLPKVELPTLAEGCSGASLAFDYNLKGGDWFVFLRDFDQPLNLSKYTHLRIAFQGANLDAHHNLQIKLVNTINATNYITEDVPILGTGTK